jgi:Tfp pilus assembly protein PilV
MNQSKTEIPPSVRKRQCGMTILEVMVASVLLVLVIGSSISALSAGMAYARHARMTTLAGQITQSVMENLRLNNYSSIITYAGQNQPVSLNGFISADNFANGMTTGMTVSGAFTTLVASGTGTLGESQVVITTTWPENGVTYTRKTMSIFTEKGLSDYIYAGWSKL